MNRMEYDLIELAERLEECDYDDPVTRAAVDGYTRQNSNYYSSNIAGALRAIAAQLLRLRLNEENRRMRVEQHWTPVTEMTEEGVYRWPWPDSLSDHRDYPVEFRQLGPSGNPQYRILSKKKRPVRKGKGLNDG